MTVDERAAIALRDLTSAEIRGDNLDPIIADAIRAALRERDARWGQAVGRVAVCSECDEALAFRPVDHQCRFCADARALLEEAGK